MAFDVGPPTRRCAATGRPLTAGERYHAVLIDAPGGRLERRDYAAEAWTGPPTEAYAHWTGRLPSDAAPEKPRGPSVAALLAIWEQVPESPDPAHEERRYVATLLLLRRKALKLQSVEEIDGADYLVVRRPRSTETVAVLDPRLDEAAAARVEDELASLAGEDAP
ncbi:MAG: hypothetical protein ACRDD1_08980 [Planctomycetia bacterium]